MQKVFTLIRLVLTIPALFVLANQGSAQSSCTPTPTSGCTGFRTYTQGGYGNCNGTPSNWLRNNFAVVFPNGIEIGCTNKLRLTSATAVQNFLPSGSTARALPNGTLTNPGSSYSNVLAGQLVAATINVRLDAGLPSFRTNSILLRDLVIASGPFAGWTVQRLLDEANKKIGGCPSTSHSFSDYNNALTRVNENYNSSSNGSGFLLCPSLVVSGIRTHITCRGGANGAINVSVSGGRTPYTFSWSNGATTEDLSGLTAGSYTVTVTDAGGQVRSVNFVLNQPLNGVTATCSSTPGTCANGNLGSVSVQAGGCVGTTSFLWNTGATTATVGSLPAGTYSVTVTDGNGCTASCTTSVEVSPCCNATEGGEIAGPEANCGAFDPAEITSTAAAAGGLGSLEYAWMSSTEGANGTFTLIDGATSASYDPGMITQTTWFKRMAKRSGCPDFGASSNVVAKTVNASPVASTENGITPVSCNGGNNGAISLSVSGGSPEYTFLWSNGATTQNISGLIAGVYSVEVTDANGCKAQASGEVSQPLPLGATASTTPVSTCVCNGTASVEVTGGTQPYTYLWNNGAVVSSVSNVCRGEVLSVTISDARGCTLVQPFNPIGFQGGCTAAEVVDFFQGPRADGSAVDANRSDPNLATGLPQNTNLPGTFFSLGFRGFVTVRLEGGIYNRPGKDLRVVETTFWAWGCARYTERARVFISADNVTWTDKGVICQDGEIDIWPLPCVNYVKIVDESVEEDFVDEPILADGFDVDGIECIGSTSGRVAVSEEEGAAPASSHFVSKSMSMHPNPSDSRVVVEMTGAKADESLMMEIFDNMGRVVRSSEFKTANGLFRMEVNIDDLPRGIYNVSVRGAETNLSQKLVRK